MLSGANEKTFCIGPYTEVRINPNGSMNFCHYADTDLIPPGDNIQKLTVGEYFRAGDSVTRTRNILEQGGYVDRCHRCYKNEENNILSFRHRRNIQAAIFPGKDFLPSLAQSQHRIIGSNPRFYHVSLSNLCNLSCMMCRPEFSSLLTSTMKKIKIIPDSVPVLEDWTQNEQTWQAFVDHLLANDQIVCLHFMGGEPLYHKKFIELIDRLVQEDHTNFHLTFVSNGTIYNRDIIEKLSKFQSVAMEISIESLDSSNDYIRFPGNYQQIKQNIEAYCQHRSEKFSLVLRTVPQLLSISHYEQIMYFAQQQKIMIDSNVLHDPDFLKLNLLPDDIKQKAIDKLSKFLVGHRPSVKDKNFRDVSDLDVRLSQHAQHIINQIQEPCNRVDELRRSLIDYCRKFDRERGLDVGTMIPELKNFFVENGYYDISHDTA